MKYIETHCHLDYLKTLPVEEIIKQANENGVEKIITVSVSPDNMDKPLQLSQMFDCVYGTQGIHPHEAKHLDDIVLAKLETNAKSSKKIVAIGEIGLDYHYDHSPRPIQREAFEKQLDLAVRLNLPVIFHSREADEDMRAIIKNFLVSHKIRGVFHSFSSGNELGKFALDNGFYIGLNGILTFKKALNVQEILNFVPVDRLLVETDAPFLAPVPHRGKENLPSYIPIIIKKIAELKSMPLIELADQIYANSTELFTTL